MNVKILKPYGFCAGVEYVMKTLDEVIKENQGNPIYCVGDLVHNDEVIASVKSKGVSVISGNKETAIDLIDFGVVVFSAHGTSDKIIQKAVDKGLKVYDAACPFVKKELSDIKKYVEQDYDILFVGVSGHDEANAVLSISSKIHLITNLDDLEKTSIKNSNIVVVNQTTLSVDDLYYLHSAIKKKYPRAIFENEICNSSRIRQKRLLLEEDNYDLVIVVGDKHSNNTQTLFKIAKEKYINAVNISSKEQLYNVNLNEIQNVLVLSGDYCKIKKAIKIIKVFLTTDFEGGRHARRIKKFS
jgi:4-hydroxy-3-methylbut-2-enyl diphosphate reductase